jgi:hypothetical protein
LDSIEEFSDAISEFLNSGNDRAAIIFAFSLLEQFIGDLVKEKCKRPASYKNLSVNLKLNILFDIGSVTESEFERIDWLRKVRNQAAHKPGYKINESEI